MLRLEPSEIERAERLKEADRTREEWLKESRAAKLARIEEEVAAFQSRRLDFIEAYMAGIGMAPHELTARWDQVPEAVKRILPKEWPGFGLSGGFGAGKTFAIAAALRKHAEEAIDHRMGEMVESAREKRRGKGWITICLAPPFDLVLSVQLARGECRRRAQLFRNQHQEVEDWILGLEDSERLLILDDIGADRVTAQDSTGETLARVIDERLRSQAPTVWTSNLDAAGLVERYGPRTFSRLQALAPLIQLPKLPDLRLSRKPA